MPIMQVTFSNVTQAPASPGTLSHLSTLMFQIEYRGKSYDCVGPVQETARTLESEGSRVIFSGYYGYNGPINIQKLRDAAIDYYQSIVDDSDNPLSLADSTLDDRSVDDSQASQPLLPAPNKSYEFYVGRYEPQALLKAS